tara:strand:- start:3541 stop:3819 length:279 start_codon:yes stop_codon:yes gene_type:complete
VDLTRPVRGLADRMLGGRSAQADTADVHLGRYCTKGAVSTIGKTGDGVKLLTTRAWHHSGGIARGMVRLNVGQTMSVLARTISAVLVLTALL